MRLPLSHRARHEPLPADRGPHPGGRSGISADRYVAAGVAPLTDAHLDVLTDREPEVLGLIARGLNSVEIAEKLFLSESTGAKTRMTRVLSKPPLRDRIQAFVVAYGSGLVRPGG
ncbi:helix-turn-helix transcriptional regulator [Streptomyces sp. P17]|uniref:response regulator transcription factor n=1 Tax=Streptomyces sp. P17 TaxID=3074716 RepID=UPI0028F44637|nr:helix-turn-helix transcriptional regulator [Streptomyces sp. P17]MDT9697998.1 helix-turn-helix transcriptional regulator [Streptomyces sp. P17]